MKKIKYKISKILALFLVVTTFMVSCEIDEGLDGSTLGEAVFGGINGVNAGLTSLYGFYFNHFQSSGLVKDYMSVFTGDDIITSTNESNKANYLQADLFNRSAANSYVVAFYRNTYTAIANCNNFIELLNKESLEEKDYNNALGNALFLRSVMFFDLTMTFGNIAFPLKPAVDNIPPVASQETVLNQIIKDLKFAADHVINEKRDNSALGPDNIDGHASKTAAKAYLAKAYMALAGYPSNATTDNLGNDCWEMVKMYTDDIINAGVYTLLDDYSHNFGWVGETETGIQTPQLWEGNKEAIWSIICQYSLTNQSREGRWFGDPYTNWKDFTVEWDYYENEFRQDDFRGLYSVCNSTVWPYQGYIAYPFPAQLSSPIVTKFQWGGVAFSSHKSYAKLNRHATPDEAPLWRGYEDQYRQSNDLVILRYAEVVLMNAEANVRKGDDTEAIKKLNWIRRRAFAGGVQCQLDSVQLAIKAGITTPYGITMREGYWEDQACPNDYSASEGSILDAIIAERGMEFVGELCGVRWFDLVRLEKVGIETPARSTVAPKDDLPLQGDPNVKLNWYFPVPSAEIQFNPDLEFNIPGSGKEF